MSLIEIASKDYQEFVFISAFHQSCAIYPYDKHMMLALGLAVEDYSSYVERDLSKWLAITKLGGLVPHTSFQTAVGRMQRLHSEHQFAGSGIDCH